MKTLCISLALCSVGALSFSAATSASEVIVLDTASGEVLTNGAVVSDNVYIFHRFEIIDSTHLTTIGGVFQAPSPSPPDVAVFAAIVSLSGASDLPDSPDLSTPDVVATMVLPVGTTTDLYTTEIDVRLAPGWYALVYGTGAFGAPSAPEDPSVIMPSLAVDLVPHENPISIRQSDGAFIIQGIEPRFYAAGTSSDTPLKSWLGSLVAVPDLNGNGSPELAVVRTLADHRAEVLIRDSATKQALGTVGFVESGLALVDLAVVRDISGEGYPELAALFRKPDGPAVVQLKDAATGSEIGRLRFFGKDWNVTALTGIERGADGPDIAVLGSRKDDRRVSLQLRDAVDEFTVARMHLPPEPGREYRDVAAVADANGDGHPEIAALFTRADGTAKVIIKDGASGARINTIGFPGTELRDVGASAIGVTGIGDLTGDGSPDVAVLWRKVNGQGIVQVRDALTGRWIHQMRFFGNAWNVVALTSLDSNWDGISDLAVLAVKDDGTDAAVQVRDASSRQALNWIGFPTSAVN